jgi:hypothetical protein
MRQRFAIDMVSESLAQKLHAAVLFELERRARNKDFKGRLGMMRLKRALIAAAADADEFHKSLIEQLMKEIF